jgi:hypothetical protein
VEYLKDVAIQVPAMIVIAVVVWVMSKKTPSPAKRKDGGPSLDALVQELHQWHKPVADPETGQPRFRWYEDSIQLAKAVRELRVVVGQLSDRVEHICPLLKKNEDDDTS